MWHEFKTFINRGNIVDLAIGVLIGTTFGKVVASLVSDVLMPPLGLLLGKVNFSHLFINLSQTPVKNLEEAKLTGVPTINYGIFLTTLIDFFFVSLALFIVMKQLNKVLTTMSKEN